MESTQPIDQIGPNHSKIVIWDAVVMKPCNATSEREICCILLQISHQLREKSDNFGEKLIGKRHHAKIVDSVLSTDNLNDICDWICKRLDNLHDILLHFKNRSATLVYLDSMKRFFHYVHLQNNASMNILNLIERVSNFLMSLKESWIIIKYSALYKKSLEFFHYIPATTIEKDQSLRAYILAMTLRFSLSYFQLIDDHLKENLLATESLPLDYFLHGTISVKESMASLYMSYFKTKHLYQKYHVYDEQLPPLLEASEVNELMSNLTSQIFFSKQYNTYHMITVLGESNDEELFQCLLSTICCFQYISNFIELIRSKSPSSHSNSNLLEYQQYQHHCQYQFLILIVFILQYNPELLIEFVTSNETVALEYINSYFKTFSKSDLLKIVQQLKMNPHIQAEVFPVIEPISELKCKNQVITMAADPPVPSGIRTLILCEEKVVNEEEDNNNNLDKSQTTFLLIGSEECDDEEDDDNDDDGIDIDKVTNDLQDVEDIDEPDATSLIVLLDSIHETAIEIFINDFHQNLSEKSQKGIIIFNIQPLLMNIERFINS
jgi:hypothetical protein